MHFTSEDIEMMETEDNSASNQTNDIFGAQSVYSKKRNFDSSQTIGNKWDSELVTELVTKSNESSNIANRKILTAKRIKTSPKKYINKYIDNKNSDKDIKICVLDTNVLLSHLSQLKSVIIEEQKRIKMDKSVTKIESFIIPWIVVQELDHMKSGKNGLKCHFTDITNAIHFINEQLKSNGLIKGENQTNSGKTFNKMKSNSMNALVDEEVNDDKIINCCLRFESFQNVVLLSNDMNLCNKAIMTGIKAMKWSEFYELYYNNNEDFDSNTAVTEEPQTKRFAKSVSHSKTSKTNDNTVPSIRYSLNHKLLFTDKSASEVFDRSNDSKMCSPVKSCSKTKSSIRRNSPKTTKIVSNNTKKRSPIKYSDWIGYKYECEQSLIKFIVALYQHIWQNEWQIMLEINTENASLKDIIRLIRKEWLSNFSDVFNRDSNVKSLVDNLHSNLSNEANYQLLIHDLKQFMSIVEEKQLFSKNSNQSSSTKKTLKQ